MKKVFALVVFMGVLALAACGSTGDGDGGDGEACGGGECGGSSKTDSTDMMMQGYIDGQQEAMYMVQLHDDPVAGQYWETSYTMAGVGTTTTRWQVAKVDGDTAIVEQQTKMEGDYSMYDYVIAYEVDTTVDETAGDANVTKAWIGKPGEKPQEIGVMAKPEATCGGEAPEYEMTEEEFTDIAMADGTWSGTLTTIKGDGWESKTWKADNGWFGGIIKTESGGMVTELTAWGEDAEPLLDWS